MKTIPRLAAGFLLSVFLIFLSTKSFSQPTGKVQVGAYYFNGWTAYPDPHIVNTALTTNYPERQSKWGWITSTPDIMRQQIDLAADAGLSFFSFCWYYRNPKAFAEGDPFNQAVNFFVSAPNSSRLKFNVMVANHQGFIIGPDEWGTVVPAWIQLFKNPNYLQVDGKPYIVFFSVTTLLQKFGSPQAVKKALNVLRAAALQAGLNGVSIGACVPPNADDAKQAEACGFDIFTAYNYHEIGFKPKPQVPNSPGYPTRAVPVSSLLNSDTLAWNRVVQLSRKPYVPAATLSFDPRPWADNQNHYDTAPYYVGYSPKTAYATVRNLVNWLNEHPGQTTAERLGVVYAWNEYGEGAWLTPSAVMNPLDGVKKAILK